MLRGNGLAHGALRARRCSAARTNRAFGIFRAQTSGAPGLSAPSCMLLSMLVSKERLLQVDVSKELALFHQLAGNPAHVSAVAAGTSEQCNLERVVPEWCVQKKTKVRRCILWVLKNIAVEVDVDERARRARRPAG